MSDEAQLAGVHFVVIGAGGLGCPALLGLSAAGAKHITIVDHDQVEASNLQRQVLYSVADVGRHKAQAAAGALRRRVPNLDVRAQVRALGPAEADAFVADLPPGALVLECTDAPTLKFALNDAGLRHGTPIVIGAALGVRGQCIAVVAGSACYRCIYEAPPAQVPTCEAAGVLGAAVGLAGYLMASLALAVCRGTEDETSGTLTAFDVAQSSIQALQPRPRPGCPACRRAIPSRFSPPALSA